MSIGVAEAAQLVGRSKQAVINAIKSGKISGEKDEDGSWRIEPVELFRYYDPVRQAVDPPLDDALPLPPDPSQVDVLRKEVELLREMLAIREDEIGDLRLRLDGEADERRRLSLLLTTKDDAPTGIWHKLFRW